MGFNFHVLNPSFRSNNFVSSLNFGDIIKFFIYRFIGFFYKSASKNNVFFNHVRSTCFLINATKKISKKYMLLKNTYFSHSKRHVALLDWFVKCFIFINCMNKIFNCCKRSIDSRNGILPLFFTHTSHIE
jgi:hypothetical protein